MGSSLYENGVNKVGEWFLIIHNLQPFPFVVLCCVSCTPSWAWWCGKRTGRTETTRAASLPPTTSLPLTTWQSPSCFPASRWVKECCVFTRHSHSLPFFVLFVTCDVLPLFLFIFLLYLYFLIFCIIGGTTWVYMLFFSSDSNNDNNKKNSNNSKVLGLDCCLVVIKFSHIIFFST